MDMRHLLEQAKNLEKALKDTDERLARHVTSAEAGEGEQRVAVRVNGAGDVVDVSIAPELAQTADAALIEETVLQALAAATAESRRFREEERAKLTGGLKLPDF